MLKKFKDAKNATSLEKDFQLDADRQYCVENFNTIVFVRPASQYERRQGVKLYGEPPKQMIIFNFGYNSIFKKFLY